jgi:hypothetical protein
MANGMSGGGHSQHGHSSHHFGAWLIFFWFVKEFKWAIPLLILLLLMGV